METFIITFLMLVVNIFMLKCKPSTPESDNRKLLIKQCNTVFILGVIIGGLYLLALIVNAVLLKVELPVLEPEPVFILFSCAILFSIFCGYLKCIKE